MSIIVVLYLLVATYFFSRAASITPKKDFRPDVLLWILYLSVCWPALPWIIRRWKDK